MEEARLLLFTCNDNFVNREDQKQDQKQVLTTICE
jgi:hypothetical protein